MILGYDILSLILWMAHWRKLVALIRGIAMATEAYMVFYILLYRLAVRAKAGGGFDSKNIIDTDVIVDLFLLGKLWLWPKFIYTEFLVLRGLGVLTVGDAIHVFGWLRTVWLTFTNKVNVHYKCVKQAMKAFGRALGGAVERICRADPRLAFLASCESGDRVTMRALLSEHEGILNVNLVRTRNGDTGLHLACRAGHMGIAESLLDVKEKVVNVNIENVSGETPLMIAAEAGHVAIVRRLLKAKGLRLKDYLGEKSVKKAVENDHYDAARLIVSAMASKEIAIDANVALYLNRCSSLLRDAKTVKSSNELQRLNLSLEVYKKNICEILIPIEPLEIESTGQKSLMASIEDLKEFLDCSICFDEFEDLKIFACINDHWICSKCLPLNDSCPFCRTSFYDHAATRRYTSEKFLSLVMAMKKSL